ncbi:GH36-type glycosyl hydrolase domain-containing protein [Enterococcus diestrammenae]|uniref:Glycosyl hydrolase 36 catalytic domain-containing protein n=1 Tax=Enterococcus diestrammenae TaxID=1155073 RepID=A0ABV0F410_9ENTE|nr:cellobiose phosphorylase [Enterococcus diestrammenae]KAF1297041.1 cellobiose phosphorylase [Enterococcus diestrammenae]
MPKITLTKGELKATFLSSGDLYLLEANEAIMINQLNGNPLDGSLNQLYLREYTDTGLQVTPLIGSNAASRFSHTETALYWQGKAGNISYQVQFSLGADNTWFWSVNLSGQGETVDLLVGQDLGNAAAGAVQSNEAYVSQYIDHHVLEVEGGYHIVSRQNQPQAGKFPVVQMGLLQGAIGYATDGYQFFGKAYELTHQPQALTMAYLPNQVYQYEFAYLAFQTGKMTLDHPQDLDFYGVFQEDHPTAVSELVLPLDQVKAARPAMLPQDAVAAGITSAKKDQLGEVISGEPLTTELLETLYPERQLEEWQEEQLYSFFTLNHHHVVLQEKELQMERSHGHILLSGEELTADTPLMSTTVYMFGLFNSQIVLGNTNVNKLMSNSRNSLNAMTHSGQRIYLKDGGKWHLLGLASAFEMGLNSATWYYVYQGDLLTITTYTVAAGREIRTRFTSRNQRSYQLLLTNHFIMGAGETQSYQLTQEDKQLKLTAASESLIASEYPDLTFYLQTSQDFTVTDESILGVSADTPELVCLAFDDTPDLEIVIQGNLEGGAFVAQDTDVATEDAAYAAFVDDLLRHFQLSHPHEEVASFNTLTRWYCHNMLVHYLSPHGLEQYGGAAWGTRDVSQGPTEFFFALDRPEIVASIIQHVFANQFADDGNWPQWFMFDRYETQKADESHGDVIVWPMKVVADYLAYTGDYGILDLQIPYTDRGTFLKTSQTASLLEHLQKEVGYIESHFLPGTMLSCYGDGDWDDTLQPNDQRLKHQMASTWTVALTYQVITKLAQGLQSVVPEYSQHLQELATGIKADYQRIMAPAGILPGFVLQNEEQQFEFIIHPTDQKTGITYRLLPMTRSMIAELLTPEQAVDHLAVIKEFLQFPDGVRLMNRPATYAGGVSTYFKRAEQAANFGREIGLQYVHAHIRFTEAMAKLGKADETWHALQIINPIQIQQHVPNAMLRQANVYFSSSDGDFKTRYEAQENFDKLRDGSVNVKGGWRIYSSGPGIFMNQMLSNVLGIRQDCDHYIFDPVLPASLDGLQLNYRLGKEQVTILYRINQGKRGLELNGEALLTTIEKNPYRPGGLTIAKDELEARLTADAQLIIYC